MNKMCCRICSGCLYHEPLLFYKDFPRGAQYMPDLKSLPQEKGIDLGVYQCTNCGVVQLSCEPVPYYREVIRASSVSPAMYGFRKRQFQHFIKRYELTQKKVLEIGCGNGEYLSIMKECGGDVYGIEYASDAVNFCRKEKLEVEKCFIETENRSLVNAPFDAFFILNFLEHIPDLPSFFSGLRNNLNKNAIGLVEVPNFDMMLKENLYTEFIPDHLYYFTKETLRTVVEMNGFSLISIDTIWDDYIISAVVRKKEKMDLSIFEIAQENLTTNINKFIDLYSDGEVAIWGAGHQAFAVIATTGIKDKVNCVIDSAFFKQGKFTPATHIPIKSPKVLKNGKIKAVIVICGGYSEEVVNIISQDYSNIKAIKIDELK